MHQSQRKPRDIRKPDVLAQKNEMREKLRSEEGYELSVRRMIEPENVFEQIKNNNQGFRCFLLRGLDKARLEVGMTLPFPKSAHQGSHRPKTQTGRSRKLLCFVPFCYLVFVPACYLNLRKLHHKIHFLNSQIPFCCR